MKRPTRLAAAAFAASIAVGSAGPAVAVTPHAHASHAQHAVKSHHKPAKGHKITQKDKRQVLRDIDHLDRRLVRVAKDLRVVRLAAVDKTAVRANIVEDRATLDELAVTVKTADSTRDLKQVRRDLKRVRVSNYTETINILRAAVRVTADSAAVRAKVEAGSEAALALDAADAKIVFAVEVARKTNSFTSKKSLQNIRASLLAAKAAITLVKDSLDDGDTGTPEGQDA